MSHIRKSSRLERKESVDYRPSKSTCETPTSTQSDEDESEVESEHIVPKPQQPLVRKRTREPSRGQVAVRVKGNRGVKNPQYSQLYKALLNCCQNAHSVIGPLVSRLATAYSEASDGVERRDKLFVFVNFVLEAAGFGACVLDMCEASDDFPVVLTKAVTSALNSGDVDLTKPFAMTQDNLNKRQKLKQFVKNYKLFWTLLPTKIDKDDLEGSLLPSLLEYIAAISTLVVRSARLSAVCALMHMHDGVLTVCNEEERNLDLFRVQLKSLTHTHTHTHTHTNF
eukprot:GHVR01109816.1.p1 GENE.GHVR01109816.1~~GHVR01109816.1.p1  ORF type:complete len:289 (+),score=86.87 GHVR01109816.1:23-868(+)